MPVDLVLIIVPRTLRSTPSILLCFLILALSSTIVAAQDIRTNWTLQGPQVYLLASGSDREFRYLIPNPEVKQTGVEKETLLFKGEKLGKTYSGWAYVYVPGCGRAPYDVIGAGADDGKAITLYGKMPSRLVDCEVVSVIEQKLEFELTMQGNEVQNFGGDGRLFSAGSDEYYLLSRKFKISDDTIGYSGEIRVVHHYEGGYELVLRDFIARCKTADGVNDVTWFQSGGGGSLATVRLNPPDSLPNSEVKESYNLYWAVCRDEFQRIR